MDTHRRLQMAKAGFVENPKIPPYRKSGVTMKSTLDESPTITRTTPTPNMKMSSTLSLSSLNTSSLLCTICEICLRILHFGDISNELIGEKCSRFVFSLKEAFYRCPRYSKQLYFVHSLYSIVPQNDREALQNVLSKLAKASIQKPTVAIFSRVVLTERQGISAGPDYKYENDEEEEISGKNALVVGMNVGGGGVMFYLNNKLEFFDSETADYFTFSQQNNQKNSAVVFKWMENSLVRIQEYIEKMFAKRNDEMRQLFKLKMRKRGLVVADEDEERRKNREILWLVNVVSLRNEAIYKPHNVEDESLVYESSFPQSVVTGLADGFFVQQEGNQLSTDVSHLQQVNHELSEKILELEGELELQKQENELKISELESQLQKLEQVLLHEQTVDEEWGDDEDRMKMKGFLQDRQIMRDRDREERDLEGFRNTIEREMLDYGKEIELEEKKKQVMKDAFMFAKERQRERAEMEKSQLQRTYQKNIVKNWGESSLDHFTPLPSQKISKVPTRKVLPAPDLCISCDTHKSISNIRILSNCSHSICVECFRSYIATWIKVPFPIQCPIGKKQIRNVKCSVPVSFQDIGNLIGAKTRQCPKCRAWILQDKKQAGTDLLVCKCGTPCCYACGTAEWPCSTCTNRLL